MTDRRWPTCLALALLAALGAACEQPYPCTDKAVASGDAVCPPGATIAIEGRYVICRCPRPLGAAVGQAGAGVGPTIESLDGGAP